MGRKSRADTLIFRNGKLVHPRPEDLAPPANGTNGTNGTTNGHANGHGAAPLQPFGNGHAGDVPRPPVPATPAPGGRNAGGQFAQGNAGGPGNPFARQVAARRQALLDAVSAEDVGRVGRKLYELALAGDTAAAKVLLAYLIGKPAEAPDPDRLDLHELALLMESPDAKKLAIGMMDCLPPQVAMILGAGFLKVNPQRVLDILDRQAAERAAK